LEVTAAREGGWCTVCTPAHGIKHNTKFYTFSAITSTEAAALCAALPEGVKLPEGGPWKSANGSCYASTTQLLVHAPGQLPETAGAPLIACSKGYQAHSTLKLTKNFDRNLKRAAYTASGGQAANGTRGYSVVAAKLEAQQGEAVAEALNAERRHEVGRCRLIASKPELKARLVSALESKM
jgi:hypothetical protein